MHTMLRLDIIFPVSIGNDYDGHWLALYFFFVLIPVTLSRSLVRSDGGAQTIATIPLHLYKKDAADTVITIFALWGLSQLLLGVVYLIVAIRYSELIPLMYLTVVAEYVGRCLLGRWKPMRTEGTPPGAIGNMVLVPLSIAMLLLSVYRT